MGIVDDGDPLSINQLVAFELHCLGDLDGDCAVGAFDLALLLGNWGPCPEPCTPGDPADICPADFDGDCTVGPFDLAFLLGNWGP